MQKSETVTRIDKLRKIALNGSLNPSERTQAIGELRRLLALDELLDIANDGRTDNERTLAMDYYRWIMDNKQLGLPADL